MSDKKYDLAIYIGRFQPFHLGHLSVLEECKRMATNTLVLVGSAFRPRSPKNPFLAHERQFFVEEVGNVLEMEGLFTQPLRDFPYRNGRWTAHVQGAVKQTIEDNGLTVDPSRIALVGHNKDGSSWYLKEFPQWAFEEVSNYEGVNATDIRNKLLLTPTTFDQWKNSDTAKLIPNSVMKSFAFRAEEGAGHWVDVALKQVREDNDYAIEYRRKWGYTPYTPTHNTVAAVVVQQGHILLVQRDRLPGRGLWCLPGGYLSRNETLLQTMINELTTGVGLKIPERFIRQLHEGNRDFSHTFDHPDRSPEGRTLSTVFFTPLDTPQDGKLPPLRGGANKLKACWVPFSEINSEIMFEDHYDIIDYFVPLTGIRP